MRKARPDGDMAMDLKHMKQLIDGNTVAIVGRRTQSGHFKVVGSPALTVASVPMVDIKKQGTHHQTGTKIGVRIYIYIYMYKI